MNGKTKNFFLNNVEILESFLKYLWKTPLNIIETKINPQEKNFVIDFMLNELKTIRMIGKVDLKENDITVRLKYTSHNNQDFDHSEACLLLSFFYKCPVELELCNQYGLYKKEDINELKADSNINQIYASQKNKNLLGDNETDKRSLLR